MSATLKDVPVSEIEFSFGHVLKSISGSEFEIHVSNIQWGFDPEHPDRIKMELVCKPVFGEIPF